MARLVDLADNVLSDGSAAIDSAQQLCEKLSLDPGTPAGALLQNVMLFREIPKTHRGQEAWKWTSEALQTSQTFRQEGTTFTPLILDGMRAAILDGDGTTEIALLGAGVMPGFGAMIEVDKQLRLFGFLGSRNGRFVNMSHVIFEIQHQHTQFGFSHVLFAGTI